MNGALAGEGRTRAVLFVVPFLCYVASSAGIPSANPGSHYATVRALGDEGRFEIDHYVAYTHGIDLAEKDGHFYSNKPPAVALAAVPLYVLGRALAGRIPLPSYPVGHDAGDPAVFFVLLLPATLAALTVVASCALARSLGAGPFSAALAGVAVGFGTLNWRYGTTLFAHGLSTFLVVAGTLAAIRIGSDPRRGAALPLAAGLLWGLAVVTDYATAALLPVVATYLVARWRLWRAPGAERGRALLLVPAAAAVPVLLLALYNRVHFGSALSTGYSHATSWDGGRDVASLATGALPGFDTPLARGLPDLLWGGGKVETPLLSTSPLLLLGAWGLLALWRARPGEAFLLTALPLTFLLVMAKFRAYWGGSVADTRYVMPVVPLLMVPLALWVDRYVFARRAPRRTAARILLLALATLTAFANARAVATFEGHPVRELGWSGPVGVRASLAALFPSAWGVPTALALWLGLALAWRMTRGRWVWAATAAARSWWRDPSVVLAALAVALMCVVPGLRPHGEPPAFRVWEHSVDGRTWTAGHPAAARRSTLYVRARFDQPALPRAGGELYVRGGCLAVVRVNKVLRAAAPTCPGSGPAELTTSLDRLVWPGPNLFEAELRPGAAMGESFFAELCRR